MLERLPISAPDVLGVAAASAPPFPASGAVRWAADLGVAYGWRIWVAEASGALQPEQCIAAVRAAVARVRCVPAVLRGSSALAVTVAFDEVEPADRPAELVPGFRLGFSWPGGEDAVVVLLAAARG